MSADGPVLDLDAPEVPDDPGAPDRRVHLGVVAAIALVVALVAAWITHAVDDERARAQQSAVVRLLVSVPADADLSGGGDFLSSSYTSTLSVVNAGPLPVEIVDLSSATDGVRVDLVGSGGSVTVPAGEKRDLGVGLGVMCRAWARQVPIDLVVAVTTDDGRRRVSQHPIDAAGPWSDAFQASCPPAF